MIATFQALVVAIFAVLPGASYVFALERVSGSFGVSLSDRLIRFLTASAVFQAILSGPSYLAYQSLVVSNELAKGKVNWLLLWAISLAYVAIPSVAGEWVGKAALNSRKWAIWLVGEGVVPTAWDNIWRSQPNALVRIKLRSGGWIGGVYASSVAGSQSYAGGFPSDGDLYLTTQLVLDSQTGEFKTVGENGTPKTNQRSLWIRASDIEYLDIQEF